ncbi:ATP synthase mitochondrial F1 complex assembly factor 2 [Hondaea fermentalgiana]|uniref:ATP synthase mitochondrial F1 complex assembly factor 2 n=1 Tax=Hondaea fermentalgiana TaxID=2315210 RepID=A0A2R5G6P6_9STRA|nr:ATP synthase mitochondrial F1 complex assembly factor 2 [Hondaea fermentalgiana]|eukprot:GBG26716.1 ATP synthase mitochondrial F1 complex assembly factor 2 [Hondaea fermentalgiana]
MLAMTTTLGGRRLAGLATKPATLRALSGEASAAAAKASSGISYKGRKRFYKRAEAVQGADEPDKYYVELDGRKLRTPYRQLVELPTEALAHGVANEWHLQKEEIQPSSMPLMTMACTAIDTTEMRRPIVVEELLRFLSTDTVLFPGHPDETEANLVDMQEDMWSPLVEWMGERFGPVNVCEHLRIPPHPEATTKAVEDYLQNLDPWTLTGIENLTSGCKSLIIPLALHHGKIDVKTAIKASRVEEEHQLTAWGLVEGGHDVDRANTISQVAAGAVFLRLCRPPLAAAAER